MKKININFLAFFLVIFNGGLLSQELKLLAGGDLNLGHWIEPILKEKGYAYPFQNISSILKSADVVFVNLEAPFCSEGQPFPKEFVFKVSPKYVQTMVEGNINLVSLANNHIMDFGDSCLYQTLKTLEQANIQYAGAGKNLRMAHKPAIMMVQEIKLALFAYSMTLPESFYAKKNSYGTAYPYYKMVTDSISFYRDKVNFILVSVHWGKELSEIPQQYQINLAHKLIDAGADLVIGHHPHILQAFEIYKKKLICYSLGNFIFSSYSSNARDSAILEILFSATEIKNARLIPINVNNYQVNFVPEIITGEDAEKLINHLAGISKSLNSGKTIFELNGNFLLKN